MCATIEDRAHYRRVKVQVLYNLPWYCQECSRSNWFLGIVRTAVEQEVETATDQEMQHDNVETTGNVVDDEEEDEVVKVCGSTMEGCRGPRL